MSAPSPSTTDSAYRRVQINTAKPAIASRGVNQPRKTKLSRPVRTCRVTRSRPDAEYCATSSRLRPPPVIEPGIVSAATSTPAPTPAAPARTPATISRGRCSVRRTT